MGAEQLNELLGGGLESKAITEMYGEYRCCCCWVLQHAYVSLSFSAKLHKSVPEGKAEVFSPASHPLFPTLTPSHIGLGQKSLGSSMSFSQITSNSPVFSRTRAAYKCLQFSSAK